MATHTIPAPGEHPEATGRTRREALGAIGFTGLAGIAVAGFARPEGFLRRSDAKLDAALLDACAAFDAAHRAVEHDNANK